jgi:hypothetical protein
LEVDVSWLDEISQLLLQFVLPLGFTALSGAVLYVRPAIRILNRTIFRTFPFTRLFRATWTVFGFVWYGISRSDFYRAACIRVECELLKPRPALPDRFEYAHWGEFRAARRKHRRDVAKWQEMIKDELNNQMQSERRPIPVPTCFHIEKARTEILRYFKVRQTGRKGAAHRNAFYSTIKVAEGFVAPLYLLTGLLSEFDEDWRVLINGYSKTVDHLDPELQDTRSFQAFIFLCWLSWGPSITFGQCTLWRPGKLLQFGYGDENNSIELVNGGKPWGIPLPTSSGGGYSVLAVRSAVTGVIKAAQAVDLKELSSVQQPESAPDETRLVLHVTESITQAGGSIRDVSREYYSAYIWVILVVCQPQGRPVYRDEKDEWRNMLTFFEHGNIADELTFPMLKRQLVAKVRPSVEQILRVKPDAVLSYACAIDDCGCGVPVVFPAPPGQSVKEMLFDDDWVAQLAARGLADRVRTEMSASYRQQYAAHSLPQVVRDYLNWISDDEDAHPRSPVVRSR